MARLGYAARGFVFLIVGALAGLAAIGVRNRASDSKDALYTLLGEPFGHGLLALIAVGLACFAAWRFTQAFLDADHQGSNFKALSRRAIYAGAAIFYLGFAWVAVGMLFGTDRGGNSDQMAREWTAWLLAKPFGQWLIGAVGVSFVVTAIAVAIAGMREDFRRRLELKGEERKIVTALGTLGYLARAFVFLMIGVFLLFAAIHARSSEAKGIAGALRVLQQQPYGAALLGITAAGLLAFGLYGIAEAVSRRISPPRVQLKENASARK